MKSFHHFLGGFKSFKEDFIGEDAAYFEDLHRGQAPKALVIGCCDSRVDPALLMDCKPGDIFVVRNVAALVPNKAEVGDKDAVMAAIEYGVKHLDLEHIIVIGHSNCGGIHGLMDPHCIAHEDHIANWVSIASPALARLEEDLEGETHEERHRRCEEGAVLISIDNLLSYDWIARRVAEHKLMLHAWYFDIKGADLYAYDPAKEDFVVINHPSALQNATKR